MHDNYLASNRYSISETKIITFFEHERKVCSERGKFSKLYSKRPLHLKGFSLHPFYFILVIDVIFHHWTSKYFLLRGVYFFHRELKPNLNFLWEVKVTKTLYYPCLFSKFPLALLDANLVLTSRQLKLEITLIRIFSGKWNAFLIVQSSYKQTNGHLILLSLSQWIISTTETTNGSSPRTPSKQQYNMIHNRL